MPPLIAGRADAMFGGFLNVEGVDLAERGLDPRVVPVDELGVPTYDELVLVADADRLREDPEPIRDFLAALERGTDGRRARSRRRDPGAPRRRRRPRSGPDAGGGGRDPPPPRRPGRRSLRLHGSRRNGSTSPEYLADNGLIDARAAGERAADERPAAGRVGWGSAWSAGGRRGRPAEGLAGGWELVWAERGRFRGTRPPFTRLPREFSGSVADCTRYAGISGHCVAEQSKLRPPSGNHRRPRVSTRCQPHQLPTDAPAERQHRAGREKRTAKPEHSARSSDPKRRTPGPAGGTSASGAPSGPRGSRRA